MRAIAKGGEGIDPKIWKNLIVERPPQSKMDWIAYREHMKSGAQNPMRFTAFSRAWTVDEQYRGLRIGTSLSQETVLICLQANMQLAFSYQHAISLRVLLEWVNEEMDCDSMRAKVYLEKMLDKTLDRYGPEGAKSSLWDGPDGFH